MAPVPLDTVWERLGRPEGFLETIADAVLGPSAIHGQGLFSTRDRAVGEHVVALDGQVVRLDVLPEVLFALEWNALSETVLLVRPLRTSYGYINHSATPNMAIAVDGVTISTVRPIASGEEFTLDYAAQPLPPRYLDAQEGAYLRLSAP